MATHAQGQKRVAEGPPAGDSKTWFGWALFHPRSRGGTHKCKACNKELKYANSTTPFKVHYQAKHEELWNEASKNHKALKERQDLAEESAAQTAPTISQLFDAEHVSQLKDASKQFFMKTVTSFQRSRKCRKNISMMTNVFLALLKNCSFDSFMKTPVSPVSSFFPFGEKLQFLPVLRSHCPQPYLNLGILQPPLIR